MSFVLSTMKGSYMLVSLVWCELLVSRNTIISSSQSLFGKPTGIYLS
jgi:hypothetical protein